VSLGVSYVGHTEGTGFGRTETVMILECATRVLAQELSAQVRG
jgi:hypothetical protein